MRASIGSRLSLVVVLATSGLAGCASLTGDAASDDDEVVTGGSAVTTRVLGEVTAIRTTVQRSSGARTSEVATSKKVADLLHLTGADAGQLAPGAPRCMATIPPVQIDYLDATGAVLGTAKFTCASLPDGKTPGQLRIGDRTFSMMADLGKVDEVNARPKVVADALWGVTRVAGRLGTIERSTTEPMFISQAMMSVEPSEAPDKHRGVEVCDHDNRVSFFRGAEEIATVEVICKLGRGANGVAVIEAKNPDVLGIIRVHPGLLRNAVGFDRPATPSP